MCLRAQGDLLARRLTEPRRLMQVVAGPRQAGKTTLVRQVKERLASPAHYASADEPALRDSLWLRQQWEEGRLRAGDGERKGAVLFLDEIQTRNCHTQDGYGIDSRTLEDGRSDGQGVIKCQPR